jgi:uncharacterized protein YecE (DUF72 family)
LGFLAVHRLPYVCVHMPQGHRDSIPPVLAATAPDLAMVRLHGHSGKWDSKDIHEQFGYRYSEAQLEEWAPKVAAPAEGGEDTHVLFNDSYRDYVQVNAQRLAGRVLHRPRVTARPITHCDCRGCPCASEQP